MFKITVQVFGLILALNLKELEATNTSEVIAKELELHIPKYENLTLLIGLTGAGKSTMSLILTGNLTEMESYKKGTSILIKDNSNKISKGNETFKSMTLNPEPFNDTATDSRLYDFPGFSDTRGAEEQKRIGLLMNQIVANTRNVRFLFIENYSSVQPGEDRERIFRLIAMILQFARNLKEYKGGAAFLATKARVPLEANTTEVVAGIAESLAEAHKFIKEKPLDWPDQGPHIQALFDSWLMQDETGGYPNIAFFRQPTQIGLLSEVPGIEENRKQIRQMVFHNPHFQYRPCNASEFGTSLSEKAILKFQGDQRALLEQVKQSLDWLKDKVVEQLRIEFVDSLGITLAVYGNTTKGFGASVQVFEDFGRTFNDLEVLNMSKELRADWKNMTDMESLMKNIPSAELSPSVTSEAESEAVRVLDEVFKAMGSKLKAEIDVDGPLARLEDAMEKRFKSGLSEIKFWRYLVHVDSSIKQVVSDYVRNVEALSELAMKLELGGESQLRTLKGYATLLKYLDDWDAEGAPVFRNAIKNKFKVVLKRVKAENKERWTKKFSKFRQVC